MGPIRRARSLRGWLTGLLLTLGAGFAPAQVPPHQPGTICFTPSFWCWAARAGQPGTVCACPSPYGMVRGTLG